MTQRKGNISVNTTDIFPIIKKWLYSEHDIFVRELVSNACDAITKRHTLARSTNQELPEGKVRIEVDSEAKSIRFIDNGLGMSEEEVEKYIAQLAFSGAEEFVQKMKDAGPEAKDEIIGKFGLGFYSSFMVADKVEINSLSMNEGAAATTWTCQGDTDYEFTDGTRSEVGTAITLSVNEENADFLQSWKLRETLTRYCRFMPYPIELVDLVETRRITEENAKAEKEEDKKPLPSDIINETQPLWKKDPASVTDEEYKSFFRTLFPMEQEPLFWLHLNIDHPFTLQGILYFPKLNPNKPVNENNIQLFSKQVFVSDNVKNVIPEFLGLLKGAIDSTDIPLNVSRSALQGDPNIKKISNYIVKKVAESLKKLFKTDREKYESIWEDIALFTKYGCVSEPKFDEQMRTKALFKNSSSKWVTLEEYIESAPEAYKEKLKGKVVYFEQGKSDAAIRQQLLDEGIEALDMDSYIDPHFMQHTEMQKQGELEVKYTLVDNAIGDILETANATEDDIKIRDFFESVLGIERKEDKVEGNLEVEVKSFKNATSAAYIKVDESMKRFAQMTQSMGNGAMDIPMKKTLVLNPTNPLVQNAFKLSENAEKKELATKLVHHVQDLANISGEGLDDKSRQDFVKRSQDLISELTSLAL